MTAPPTPNSVAAVDIAALHRWLGDHTQHLVDDLVALAEHETPSDDPALLDQGVEYFQRWVRQRLGEPASLLRHRSDEYGDVLVLDYAGCTDRRVTALAHYDTVFSAGTLRSWPVTVEQDRVRGPGVFDMKAGLVQVVWALRVMTELGIARPAVRLVLNGDEEIGSPFSRPLLEEASKDADAVLVFEASADAAVKTARKGVGLFRVEVTGAETHAGLDPTAGASAVGEIAHMVTTLHGAADLDRGTSINVGTLHGGSRANVVAGHACADVDVRVTSGEEMRRVDEVLAALRARDPRADVRVLGEWNRPVMPRDEGVGAMFALARAAAEQLGVDLREASVGGASDGNFVAAMGIPVLDGLGAIGAGAHARHEHVTITGMVERAAVAAGVIGAFAAPPR